MASFNRNQKHIWEVKSSSGAHLKDQGEIKLQVVNHFKLFFEANTKQNINNLARITSLYPRMVGEEEAISLFKPVTLKELKSILENFKKEKSSGPNGWSVEFFTFFFDLVGGDLLEMVEDLRRRGHLCEGINSTFLSLIPKENKSISLDDFRPISLCNLCYKVISKVIANRLKLML
jgi:DNA-directed RNA polymerase subunit F